MKNRMIGFALVCVALMLLLVTACENGVSSSDELLGTLVDARDGQQYKTVKIGNQTWMAQNLNYFTGNSLCYDFDAAYCSVFGQLYTWEDALIACPQGWHLPSKEEFEELREYLNLKTEQMVTQKNLDMVPLREGEDKYYNHLRDASWNNGFDTFGFSVLPAGIYDYYDKAFNYLGNGTHFWFSSEVSNNDFPIDINGKTAYSLNVTATTILVHNINKLDGVSVRCLKN